MHKRGCTCEHEAVSFCKPCQVVYCKGCNAEWVLKNVYYPGWTYTYPHSPGVSSSGTGLNDNIYNDGHITLCAHK